MNLKEKILQSNILSDIEKKDWLFLLPKMNETQIAELQRILAVHLPEETQKLSTSPGLSATLSRPGEGQGVRIHPSVIHPEAAPLPNQKVEKVFEKPLAHNSPQPSLTPREGVSAQAGGLTVEALRAAKSVYEFFDDLAARMVVRIKNRETTPAQIISTFQDSAIYQAYVQAGKEMLEGREPQALTRSEFEAVADFRTSLKKILNT